MVCTHPDLEAAGPFPHLLFIFLPLVGLGTFWNMVLLLPETQPPLQALHDIPVTVEPLASATSNLMEGMRKHGGPCGHDPFLVHPASFQLYSFL